MEILSEYNANPVMETVLNLTRISLPVNSIPFQYVIRDFLRKCIWPSKLVDPVYTNIKDNKVTYRQSPANGPAARAQRSLHPQL